MCEHSKRIRDQIRVSLNKGKLQKWYGANIERNLQAILEPFPP